VGAIRCTPHGLVIGLREVCPHVAQQVQALRLGPHHQIGQWLLCDACMDARLAPFDGEKTSSFLYGKKTPEQEAAWEAYHDLHPTLDVVCPECTAAAMNGYARHAGLPDPWPSYEHTLTNNEHDYPIVEQLRELVEAFRPWRLSIVDPRYSSCTVQGGAYTHPLEVQCYYVVQTGEQDALVAFVRKFLAGQAKNQGVVRFLDAENWIVKPNGSAHRGPEAVVREVYLNCSAPRP